MALAAFEAENAQDPKQVSWEGTSVAREVLFAQRVAYWISRLVEQPSDPLIIAAHCHTIRRWDVARNSYPMNSVGYHQWRDACANHHAMVSKSILEKLDFDSSFIKHVVELILKKNWPSDPNARILEDADCLAFLELKLADYLDEWEQVKAVRILRKTMAKMTPQAVALVASIPLDPRCREWLSLASAGRA